ncbi:unnamed protein product [Coccothraustes coccothraustes]
MLRARLAWGSAARSEAESDSWWHGRPGKEQENWTHQQLIEGSPQEAALKFWHIADGHRCTTHSMRAPSESERNERTRKRHDS